MVKKIDWEWIPESLVEFLVVLLIILTIPFVLLYELGKNLIGDMEFLKRLFGLKKGEDMRYMKQACFLAAMDLLKANNTVTTLEVKLRLRKDEPKFNWSQVVVSRFFDELVTEGKLVVTADNGTYRTYSDPTTIATKVKLSGTYGTTKKATVKAVPKKTSSVAKAVPKGRSILRKTALELMKNSKGQFFTAVFLKKDGKERTMNCQFLKDQGDIELGYVRVRDSSLMKKTPAKCIRNVNLQTLKKLVIGGKNYTIR